MAYDYYKAAEAFAAELKEEGYVELEQKILQVMEKGFSSTEILMGLRFVLSREEFLQADMSLEARSLHTELLSKLKSALVP